MSHLGSTGRPILCLVAISSPILAPEIFKCQKLTSDAHNNCKWGLYKVQNIKMRTNSYFSYSQNFKRRVHQECINGIYIMESITAAYKFI